MKTSLKIDIGFISLPLIAILLSVLKTGIPNMVLPYSFFISAIFSNPKIIREKYPRRVGIQGIPAGERLFILCHPGRVIISVRLLHGLAAHAQNDHSSSFCKLPDFCKVGHGKEKISGAI
jgi:hypothetical protein